MRVLVNGLQAANRSGTGRYTIELVRALAGLEEGPELTVAWPRDLELPSAVGEVLPMSSQRLARLAADQWGLRRAATRCHADLVHYPANVGALFGGVPTVLTVHDLSFLHHPEWFRAGRAAYYRWAVRRSARLAARVIADSRSTADDLCALAGVSGARIDVVPLGVAAQFSPAGAEQQQEVRGKYGLPESFLLYVGTLEPRKNIPRLIEAWSRVADECALDLVIAGREGWKVGPIRAAAQSSPHMGRIHLPGFIENDDLPAVLSAARVFAWPSLFEGFGLPVLEAMACGTPVLTSNRSSLPEVVGEAAVAVDPEDTDALADGILRVLETHEELREKGPARAAEFTWRRTAELTHDVYRRAAG